MEQETHGPESPMKKRRVPWARSDWIALAAVVVAAMGTLGNLLWTEYRRIRPPDLRFVEEWSAQVAVPLAKIMKAIPIPPDLAEAFQDLPEDVRRQFLLTSSPFGSDYSLEYMHTVTIVNIGGERATGIKVEIDGVPTKDGFQVQVDTPVIYSSSISTADHKTVVKLPELHSGMQFKILIHGSISLKGQAQMDTIKKTLRKWQNRPTKVIHAVSEQVTGISVTRNEGQCLKWNLRCVTSEDLSIK